MERDPIAEEIRTFIELNFRSIEQLEILLLLKGRADTFWTAEQVSKELRTNPVSVELRLIDLFQKKLIYRGSEGYRYVGLGE